MNIEEEQQRETYHNLNVVPVANNTGLGADRVVGVGRVRSTGNVFANVDLSTTVRPGAPKGPARALVQVVGCKEFELAASVLNSVYDKGRGWNIVGRVENSGGSGFPKDLGAVGRKTLDRDNGWIGTIDGCGTFVEDSCDQKRFVHARREGSSRLNGIGEVGAVKDRSDWLSMSCSRVDETAIHLNVTSLDDDLIEGHRVLAGRRVATDPIHEDIQEVLMIFGPQESKVLKGR